MFSAMLDELIQAGLFQALLFFATCYGLFWFGMEFFERRRQRADREKLRIEIQESNERWRIALEKEREVARIEEARWRAELQIKREAEAKQREAEAKRQEEFREEAASRCNIPYLTKLCHTFIYYVDYIPEPKIIISDDDAFEDEAAHFNRNGYFIRIRRNFLLRASQAQVNNLMKHELIHAWIHQNRIKDTDVHGVEFCKKAAEIGVEYKHYQQPTQHLKVA